MKKITLLAVAFVAISFASCKKDYTCTCSYTSGTSTASSNVTYTKVKKKDAQKSCDAANANMGGLGSCTLK